MIESEPTEDKSLLLDAYLLKTIPFRFWGSALQFRVSQELFSSHDIDVGTRFLMRTLEKEALVGSRRVLDLGCGYGTIGLIFKALNPFRTVHMVDRDALAVEYSRRNADLNALRDVAVYGSLGYDDVKASDFDLIVSNIPGKAGEPVVTSMLLDARLHLAASGSVAVVVVKPLEEIVRRILDRDPTIDVASRKSRPGHVVFHYSFRRSDVERNPEKSDAFERGVYDRAEARISVGTLNYDVRTVYGLPEFDSLGWGTEFLIEGVGDFARPNPKTVLVFNPGQGHIPVAIWMLRQPRQMTLADRDLLALRSSKRNLTLNGMPAERIGIRHRVDVDDSSSGSHDLVVGLLSEEGPGVNAIKLAQIARQLSDGGRALIVGTSTEVSRLVRHMDSDQLLRLVERRKRRGNSLLVLDRAKP